MAKPKLMPPANQVRTRRAYFDCRFGQLHVRTAFPTTGGFDEQVTLFCLHRDQSSSRMFTQFLPEIAAVRSVYAPDLPGHGESDPVAAAGAGAWEGMGADAMSDLADDLRLRQIDVLGVGSGAVVALNLAANRPQLVRRVVLVGTPPQSAGLLAKLKAALPAGALVAMFEPNDDIFGTAPNSLAKEIDEILTRPS